MSGPYVCFRVNRTSRAILTETIKYEPDPMVSFTNPFEWFVVCDSADKVVIRALEDGKRSLSVIAIAQLRGTRLEVRRQTDHAMPTPALWAWLEDVVFPMREHGHGRGHGEAIDPAEMTAAPPPAPPTPEQVWGMAAGVMPPLPGMPPQRPSFVPAPPPARPSFVPATPSPPTSPPPSAAPPAAPLWGPVANQAMVAANGRYIEFVFDHASVVVMTGAVRYVPDPSLRPTGRYEMKLACDVQGQVSLQVAGDDGLIVIALARWRDSALCDRQQQGPEPDDFQWIALEDALRAELTRAP